LKVLGLFPKTKIFYASAFCCCLAFLGVLDQSLKGRVFVFSEIGGYHHETFILFSLFLSLFFLGYGRVKQAKKFARVRSKMRRKKAFECKVCGEKISYREYIMPPKAVCIECTKKGYGNIYKNVGGNRRI